MKAGRFARLAETDRPNVTFFINGVATEALQGDILLVAILASETHLRRSEFGDGNRAGFCLMGSCQDCWVSTEDGQRIKACSANVVAGMRVCTTDMKLKWAGKK